MAGTTADKLQGIIDAKADIASAITSKGGTVPSLLEDYGDAIRAIPSGGGGDKFASLVDKSITTVTASDLSGVTSIGSYAFYNCIGLTSVTIGNGVTSIGNRAFEGCSGLASVTIGNGITSIGASSFQNCSGLTSVTIPDTVTSIAGGAFTNCTSLTSITLPDSVTGIEGGVFTGCTGLTSVTMGNRVTYIAAYAFQTCTSLTSITLPDSVTSIGSGTFDGCSGLTSVTIGNGAPSISSQTFRNCSSCLLYDFRSATRVLALSNVNAFQGTNANKKIVVPDALYDEWISANNWNSSTNGIVTAITRASDYNP